MAESAGFFKSFINRLLGGDDGEGKTDSKAQGTAASADVLLAEGLLRLAPAAGPAKIDLFCRYASKRIFGLSASLNGTPSEKKRVLKDNSGTEYSLAIPLKLGNGRETVMDAELFVPAGVKFSTADGPAGADAESFPEGKTVLSFAFAGSGHDLTCVFSLPENLEPLGFKETADSRPIFQSVPSAEQMAFFLNGITGKKRTAKDVLKSFRLSASPALREVIDAFLSALKDGLCVNEKPVLELKELFSGAGRKISDQVLEAFAVFIEMAVGRLRAGDFKPDSEGRYAAVEISAPALYLVSSHFGLPLSDELWRKLSFSKNMSWEEADGMAQSSVYSDVPERLKTEWDNRAPVNILSQLAEEGGSHRAAAFAKALRRAASDSQALTINDRQLAVTALLSASGCRCRVNTAAALCMFIDSELGVVSADDIKLESGRFRIPTSSYAMQTVASAFGLSTEELVLAEEHKNEALEALADCVDGGLLAGFTNLENNAREWILVSSSRNARKAVGMTGKMFCGSVIASLPKISSFAEDDIPNLLKSGQDFIFMFRSDSGSSVWRRFSSIPKGCFIAPEQDGVRSSFSFIEKNHTYKFARTVLGRILEVPADTASGTVITAECMSRAGRRSFVSVKYSGTAEETEKLIPDGTVWTRRAVFSAASDKIPDIIFELSDAEALKNV